MRQEVAKKLLTDHGQRCRELTDMLCSFTYPRLERLTIYGDRSEHGDMFGGALLQKCLRSSGASFHELRLRDPMCDFGSALVHQYRQQIEQRELVVQTDSMRR